MSERLVVFRADASAAIGGGHVMRCLALAGGLIEAGWRCAFACRTETLVTVPALAASDFDCLVLDGTVEDEPNAIQEYWSDGAALLVVDHYRRGIEFESPLRTWAGRIMVLDDLADRYHDCDILLDPTPGRNSDDYQGLVPIHCRLLVGPEHALLASAFAASRDEALRRRGALKQVNNLLISFGASDPHRLTPRAIAALASVGFAGRIKVAVGADDGLIEEVRAVSKRTGLDVDILIMAPDMPALMLEADLTIGGAGLMSWERCCLGLPSVVVCLADNQRPIAEAIEERGAAAVAGRSPATTTQDIALPLAELIKSAVALSAMSQAAASMCDGSGVPTVVAGIMSGYKPA